MSNTITSSILGKLSNNIHLRVLFYLSLKNCQTIFSHTNNCLPKMQYNICIFQNLNPVCYNHRKHLGQGYTGYTMLCTGYIIFTMERNMYII